MCTVFQYCGANLIIGKNYDIPAPCKGMVFTNQRGLKKQALVMPPETPKQWRSEYGSLTFSQVGKEFPSCGMNEAGLVVEQTTLWNTVYPDRDSRPAIKDLQWIQYMLDTCSTVDGVIDQLDSVRILQEVSKLQFFVSDTAGDIALVEYILGRPVVFRQDQLPHRVIANDMYQTSLDYLALHRGYGGIKAVNKTSVSIDRFVSTVDGLRNLSIGVAGTDAADFGLAVLERSSFEHTQWQIIYEPNAGRILYRSRTSPSIKEVIAAGFDFSCPQESYARDIDAASSVPFQPYTRELNYQLAKHFFTETVFSKAIRVSESELAGFSQYPETYQP